MPPKRNATTPHSTTTTTTPSSPPSTKPTTTSTSTPRSRSSKPTTTTTTTSTLSSSSPAQDIISGVWSNYLSRTPQRVKLIDVFMAFLVAVGVLQFAYCVVGGGYPFNAFLSGFSATVGQFVLTASLRIQTNPENKDEFKTVSHERAFADYVFGSLILHFFCVNFIN